MIESHLIILKSARRQCLFGDVFVGKFGDTDECVQLNVSMQELPIKISSHRCASFSSLVAETHFRQGKKN